MKKIGIVGLILVFIQLVLLGPLFLLQHMRWKEHMMTEIKQNLSDFQAEELYFSDAQYAKLRWHEGKREFSLGSKFYDVIEIKTVYGGKVIKCVNDKEEELLVKRYIDSGKGKVNPFQQLLKISWLKCVMEPQEPLPTVRLCTSSPQDKQQFHYVFAVKEFRLNTAAPPPNFV